MGGTEELWGRLCSATSITPLFLTDQSPPEPISEKLLHLVVSIFPSPGHFISVHLEVLS